MYAVADGWSRLNAKIETATNVRRYERTDLNNDILKKGYILFESIDLRKKKSKSIPLLVQLVNPTFSDKIRVYATPKGGNTMGLSVGGIGIAGGLEKQYIYQKEGDKEAYYLEKKDYKKMFPEIFGDCQEFMDSVDKPKWRDFAEHIATYSEMCGG